MKPNNTTLAIIVLGATGIVALVTGNDTITTACVSAIAGGVAFTKVGDSNA